MQETFFTSSVMMGFFNFIKEIGLLNFIAGGIAVMAFGYGYHQLHPNATVPRSKNWSGIGLVLSRVVLGSILFVIGGLNGFFQFVPVQMAQDCIQCGQYINGLIASGFLFPAVKSIELFTGALFLLGLWLPLALVISAPIVVNIALYHMFLAPSGLGIALLMVGLELYLAYRYREVFIPLFQMKPTPAEVSLQEARSTSGEWSATQ